jgi:hypothetical protein
MFCLSQTLMADTERLRNPYTGDDCQHFHRSLDAGEVTFQPRKQRRESPVLDAAAISG